ncbi:hypothetical protein AB0P17_11350 [Streptomyces sp. NPDC088124]|uniref:hypothetical protein n=1 Tax=Streptomyces sp. NPDC088124 TaxID=3154654 RepID=UPI0034148541
MDFADHSAYRVPTGRPFLLKELYSKLAGVGELIGQLPVPADPTEYEEIADSLYSLFNVARNLAPDRNSTGCQPHPKGAVGWGRCLLCNSHRRTGRPDVKAAPQAPRHNWAVPPPPYDHTVLAQTMQLINDLASEINFRSEDETFVHLGDLTHGAFVVARELSRLRNSSGCAQHPGAPIDPAAPGGPQCLFCQGQARRQQTGPPTVAIRPVPGYERRRMPRPHHPSSSD